MPDAHAPFPPGAPRRRVRIGPVDIDPIPRADLPGVLDGLVASGGAHAVAFCDSHVCARASTEADLRAALAAMTLVLPDGVSMTAGARLLGHPWHDRLPGPLVMLDYCAHGVAAGRRHFFYGGAPGVPDALASRLCEAMPGLVVAGIYSPPFRELTDDEERDVAARIEGCGTEVLWVGLGAPKQELWMTRHLGRLHVPLMLGVGAAFDFHSGARRWAPPVVRRLGLEWAYRMLTGGRRVAARNARYVSLFVGVLAAQVARERLLGQR